MINRVFAEKDAERAITSKSGDDVCIRIARGKLDPFDKRSSFAEQVFPVPNKLGELEAVKGRR